MPTRISQSHYSWRRCMNHPSFAPVIAPPHGTLTALHRRASRREGTKVPGKPKQKQKVTPDPVEYDGYATLRHRGGLSMCEKRQTEPALRAVGL